MKALKGWSKKPFAEQFILLVGRGNGLTLEDLWDQSMPLMVMQGKMLRMWGHLRKFSGCQLQDGL
eukprot:1615406-Ditylum_brightwellii.AAC.1